MDKGENLNEDLWIRGKEGLVQQIPNVLWVIADREKLKWEQFDAGWTESMDQHILGNLSDKDSIGFLFDAGIKSYELRENLYELTKGVPAYLDICVDTYFSIVEKRNEPTIDKFGQDEYELVKRFSIYMDDSKKELVYMLSVLSQWSDDMVEAVKSCISNFSYVTYDKVKGFSFVSESEPGVYKMHELVADVLYKQCPASVKKKTIDSSIAFCKQELEKYSSTTFKYSYYVNWLMELGLKFENITEQIDYYYKLLSNYIDEIIDAGKFSVIEGNFYKYLDIAQKSNDKTYLSCFYGIQAHQYAFIGEYAKALEYHQKALEIREKVLGEEHPDTASSYNNIGSVYVNIGDYNKALEYFQKLLKLKKKY